MKLLKYIIFAVIIIIIFFLSKDLLRSKYTTRENILFNFMHAINLKDANLYLNCLTSDFEYISNLTTDSSMPYKFNYQQEKILIKRLFSNTRTIFLITEINKVNDDTLLIGYKITSDLLISGKIEDISFIAEGKMAVYFNDDTGNYKIKKIVETVSRKNDEGILASFGFIKYLNMYKESELQIINEDFKKANVIRSYEIYCKNDDNNPYKLSKKVQPIEMTRTSVSDKNGKLMYFITQIKYTDDTVIEFYFNKNNKRLCNIYRE